MLATFQIVAVVTDAQIALVSDACISVLCVCVCVTLTLKHITNLII